MAEDDLGLQAVGHDLEDLNGLDAKGLARRWRTLIGGTVPAGVGRALMLRVLAYHLQAQRHGDLDRATRQALNDILLRSAKRTMEVGSNPRDRGRMDALRAPQLRPGTVLSREYGGTLQRVMVMEQGFSWNGRIYDSLSKVAFAITGTRWNGPRFFGLRDRSGGNQMTDGARSAAHRAAENRASGNETSDKRAGRKTPIGLVSARAASP